MGRELGALSSRKIGVLGLAYKAGTDAIRRSIAIEIIQELIAEGAEVTVFDPKVSTLPELLSSVVTIASSVDAVFADSEAVVVATEWPEFRELNFAVLVPTMKRALLIDQNKHFHLAGIIAVQAVFLIAGFFQDAFLAWLKGVLVPFASLTTERR